MKAITFTEYGSPDVLKLEQVDKPIPKENEVLVKIHAAGANPLDWRIIRAEPFLVRTSEGWLKPKDGRLGADVAGQVEAVGTAVTQFKVGDRVFGECSKGAFAEYTAVAEHLITHIPEGVSFEDAAAIPVAGITALQGLRDHGQLKAGDQVLINGASGGIGTYAVQIAKALGAHVTAVCSTPKIELVCSLGADQAIDYTKDDFTRSQQKYDLVLDNVGNRSVAELMGILKPQGICVVAGFSTMIGMFKVMTIGAWRSKKDGQKISSMMAHPTQSDLAYLAELLASGQINTVIDRRYPLEQTAEALRYLEQKHARGKVIISVC